MREHNRPDDAWQDTESGGAESRQEQILERLGDEYWRRQYGEDDPQIFAGIVRTILSQNQQDSVSGPAAERLTDRYGTGDEMLRGLLDADTDDLADLIYPCGPHNQKASSIRSWASWVDHRFGDTDALTWWVDRHDPDEIRAVLSEASGVGRKTIDVVLAFNAGKDGVFPVDTHVHRVARRTGMVPERSSPTETSDILESTVSPSKAGWGHTTMIAHGRRVCHAQNPECDECPILDICPQIIE